MVKCSVDRTYAFFTKYAHENRGFYEKLDANDMKHRVFERMDVFSTKYGHESGMFLENGRFLPNMGMTAVIFS